MRIKSIFLGILFFTILYDGSVFTVDKVHTQGIKLNEKGITIVKSDKKQKRGNSNGKEKKTTKNSISNEDS